MLATSAVMRRHLCALWRMARRTRHEQATLSVRAVRLCGSAAGMTPPLTVSRRGCCTATWGTGGGDGGLHSGGNAAETSAAVEPEVITLDAIEVEVMDTDTFTEAPFTEVTLTSIDAEDITGHGSPTPHQHPFSAHSSAAAAAPASDPAPQEASSLASSPRGAYTDVRAVDTFARGHVVNFMRRMGHNAPIVFHVRELSASEARAVCGGDADGPPVFAATCQLPLPEPHKLRVAEGFAEDPKEAEVLAAMHAERVCDALGVQLFRIKTAQQKHADAVRREEGRYAPYPGDPVMPAGTPVPPPLRFLRTRAAHAPHTPQKNVARKEAKPAAAAAAAAATKAPPAASTSAHATSTPKTHPATPTTTSSSPPPLHTHDGAGGDAPAASTSGTGEKTRLPRIVLRRHEPLLDYAQFVPQYTDAEHAARVQAYASTVVYPWDTMWDTTLVNPALSSSSSASRSNGNGSGGGAGGAPGSMLTPLYDPSEGGLWAMVNDRNYRCSPTPEEALVLPFVYDGPHAEARLRAYYTQHGTTLEKQLSTRLVPGAPGSLQRWVQAELRLVGLTVLAKGCAPAKEVAVRLAAMHAELLLDALGHTLFPQDCKRQARHANVVHGYGRWAMNPLTGNTTSPNPHDALPLPMKLQVGGDDVWMAPVARQQFGEYWSESQHVVNAASMLHIHAEQGLEMQPPPELLDEAYAMLQEWQVHIAKNRFPNLFILTDLEAEYRATTLTPVPAAFGVRGGVATGRTREDAVRLCALHALDSLCVLGIPLCVDAAQERAYMQRRAALGMLLPRSFPEDAPGVCEHSIWSAGTDPRRQLGLTDDRVAGQRGRMSGPRHRLPMYVWEGNQVRLMPRVADFLASRQLQLPHDFCVFGRNGSAEDDVALVEAGNMTRIAVSNYLQSRFEAEMRERNSHFPGVKPVYGAPAPVPSGVTATTALPHAEDGDNTDAAATTTATTTAAIGADEAAMMAGTLAWAHSLTAYATPVSMCIGYTSLSNVHNLCFLPIPLPDPVGELAAEWVDTTGVAAPPSPLAGHVYALAVGVSLKRKDAERACFAHAASVLHSLGVDVLRDYRRGLRRCGGELTCFADLAKLLGQETLTIVSPYLPDGTLRPEPQEDNMPAPASVPPAPESPASAAAAAAPPDGAEPSGGDAAPASPRVVPLVMSDSPPGSLHPPRPTLHLNMKYFLESTRGITLPRRRRPNARDGKL